MFGDSSSHVRRSTLEVPLYMCGISVWQPTSPFIESGIAMGQ